MRSFAKRTLLFALLFGIVFAATNAYAVVEGVRVSVPDTCWYRYSFINLPVFIEWTTWSRYQDCNAEYWVPPWADPYVCRRSNVNPPCPCPSTWSCPTSGPNWQDTCNQWHSCTFTQTCELTENPDDMMCSFDVMITFDPNVVNATGAASGLLMNQWGWGDIFFEYDNNAGWIRISAASARCGDLTEVEDPTNLFFIGFEVVTHDVSREAHLYVESFQYNEVDPVFVYYGHEYYHRTPGPCWDNHPCSLYVDARSIGDLEVCEYESVSGLVSYCLNDLRICNATVTLEYMPDPNQVVPPAIEDHVVSTQCEPGCGLDCRGKYFIGDIVDGYDYCLYVWKDDEYNNAITPFDASIILRYMVDDFPLFCCGRVAADVSGNCEVSAFDASLVMKYLVEDPMAYPYFPRKRDDHTNWLFFFCEDDRGGDYCCRTSCPPEERCYDPLLHSYFFQNFKGVILGDVSGNWGSGPDKLAVSRTADQISYEIVESDVMKTVYAITTDVPDVFGFQFDAVGAASVEVVAPGWMSESNAVDNRIRVAAASVRACDGVLAHVTVENGAEAKIQGVVLNETALIGSLALLSQGTVPTTYYLANNYPNPFNPTTSIAFSLPTASDIKLAVYNVLGQHVATLASGTYEAGTYRIDWNGTDDAGVKVSSGIYLYRLETAQFVETKKMMLLK